MVSRGHERVEANLGIEPRWLFGLWILGCGFVGLTVGLGAAISARGRMPGPKTMVIWAITLLIWLVIVVVAVTRKRMIVVDADRLIVNSKGEGFVVPFSNIGRMSTFSASSFGRVIVIEQKDGTQHRLLALSRNKNPEIDRCLEALAARTKLTWHGRDEPASFSEFARAVKEASHTTTTKETIVWMLRRAFVVQVEDAGVSDPMAQWAVKILSLKVIISFLFLQYFQTADGLSVTLRTVMITAVVADWMVTCFSVNVLATLMRTHIRSKESLEAELTAAREVQRRLLPVHDPSFEHLEISGACLPAKDVGGDYYDFILGETGALTIPVADVSGKGLPAGLLMTLTKGALTTSVAAGEEVSGVLCRVNRTIKMSSDENMFVSMVLAQLDPRSALVTIGRAGHNPPLLVRNSGEVAWINPAGMALGMDAGARFDRVIATTEVQLDRGDVLVLYTDGVTEAMNRAREEYGEARFEQIIRESRGESARVIKELILANVEQFRGGADVNDDLTLVVIKSARA